MPTCPRTASHAHLFWVASLLLMGAAATLAPPDLAAQEPFRSRCGAGVHADARTGLVVFPQGGLFCPLVADPKAEKSFLSYHQGDFATIASPEPESDTDFGSVGIGDSFALLRWAGSRPGDGLQVDLAGAVFAQFNLDQPSSDLVNADYLVGFPVTFRRGGFSSRLRIYHQSSHLGDEFILNREPERENLSFESLELILSQEMGPLRVYGGGETFFRRDPADVASRLVHAGLEVRPATVGAGRLVAAVDLKAVELLDWKMGWSARAGVEIARVPSPGHPPRIVSLLAEFYEGPAPYGQFYREDIRFIGLGFHFSL